MISRFQIGKASMVALASVTMLSPVIAQLEQDVPLLRPEERKVVDAQTVEFNLAITPVLEEAGKSTVRVWYGKNMLSYGTVVGDGTEVLTKWSEVSRWESNLIVQAADRNDVRQAKVERVYRDEDLAILKITGDPLPPVQWVDKPVELGTFMAAAQPAGKLAGFGVVSVLARNLRETDKAFLGVFGAIDFKGDGVKVQDVSEGSGAEKAGIKSGDVILKSGDRDISGLLELQNSLVGLEPGDKVELLVERSAKKEKIEVTLGNRPALPSFQGSRLKKMEQMGTRLSQVRDSFSNAIQTDMALDPSQVGGPVVDLKGQVIGVTVARADRTRSFVVPSSTIMELIQEEGMDPALAKLEPEEQEGRPTRVRRIQGQPMPQGPTADQMQMHLNQMQKLLDLMQEEMEALQRER